MKAVIQRVSRAEVRVNDKVIGKISQGLVVLLGVGETDGELQVKILTEKVSNLRIFGDEQGKMNLSVKDVNGEILVVSQFTLIADTKKGNRPSFVKVAKPEQAQDLYNKFVKSLEELGHTVATGQFQATMEVELVNDGPVTIILEN